MSEQEYMTALEYALPLVRDRKADVYVSPGEPHIKFGPRHKPVVYERNLDWFRFWLQGHERADPVAPGQYSVCRSMEAARSGAEAVASGRALPWRRTQFAILQRAKILKNEGSLGGEWGEMARRSTGQ